MTCEQGARQLEDADVDPVEPMSGLAQVALATLVVTGYVSPLLAIAALVLLAVLGAFGLLTALGALVVWLLLIVRVRRDIARHGARVYRAWADALVLGVLPAWGLFYAFALADNDCTETQCGDVNLFRPFATPEIYGLLALHALVSVAYLVSRRRPEALRPRAEVLVLASLLTGIVAHTLIAVHFGRWLLLGLIAAPVFLPCLAPVLTVILLFAELRRRLRRRGREALQAELAGPGGGPYRQGSLPIAPFRVHRGLLLRALAASPLLLGLHATLHALWLGRRAAALDVLTRTCDYTFSQVPIQLVPADCHYLCTVAARGHSWLVRPERQGWRGGVPILVNRQLAIANAFEDLLHERWPRFGRLARAVYDRLGLPVSRYIRTAWLADIVYLLMKPLEWAFAISLLLLDRRPPEARIDRMYRR